ncbi:hypothetical protein [Streptomyces camelliae]|uniref:Uncharacterized protein n=1 Tax=Streptomyces camelliae TaxID=3004093 RepID=A0ABY7PIY8_9ACTN|nr:hypothetical protein [Streptomyces sp. HUAS 2-6]WBO69754.1 hypothetical protein O1G22_44275 [Streptomyces sp. HUAS 2-6]
MNPGTYARLYGPPQLAPRRERSGVVVLAWALWVLSVASLAWLTFLVAVIALWGAAEGEAVGGFVLEFVLISGRGRVD